MSNVIPLQIYNVYLCIFIPNQSFVILFPLKNYIFFLYNTETGSVSISKIYFDYLQFSYASNSNSIFDSSFMTEKATIGCSKYFVGLSTFIKWKALKEIQLQSRTEWEKNNPQHKQYL